ncbi:MAG: UvrB/UvrC motif-containing protein [Planctomycetota bacterium]
MTRKLLREKCPLVPGIYGWLDHNRQLVYVGKSKSLRLRLLGYFAKNPSDPKMKRIRQHSDRIVWEPISHELLALVRESELIHRWRPEFNSMGQPTRMQPAFVCIGGQPAPNARLVRRLNESHKLVYGPISGTKRLRMAIECLNQIFQLRDCADKTKFEFKNQKFLFDDHKSAKCIRFELGTCPAPCAGLCSRQHYQSNVDALISFLNGDSTVIIDQAEQQMSTLAERQSYESAAIYRDYLKHLKWLDRRLHGLRMAEENLNGLLPIAARKGRPGWLALQGGRISRTFSVSATPGHEEKIASDIAEIISCGDSRPNNLLAMSLQLIVIAWLKKNPSMKNEIIPFHSAANHLAESAGLHSRQSA